MNLRSLKLVHFRGLPQIHIRDVPAAGVVRIPVPAHRSGADLADALRFAMLGVAPPDGATVSDGQGYAYVELGFRLPGDSQASLFRGVDRRGTEQVSLREEGGLRVTGGSDAVRDRLAVLLDDDLEGWCARVLVGAVDTTADGVAGVLGSLDAPQLPVREPLVDADAAAAIETWRASRRADRLRRRALSAHADLLDCGRTLRRARADTALAVDRVSADRDRVRTRLRRLNEYRDVVAQGDARTRAAATSSRQRPGFATEWGLATCASVLLLVLVIYSTSPAADADRRTVQVGLGLGFLVAAASYLGIATRRHTGGIGRFVIVPDDRDDDRVATPPPSETWRDSLRARFADVGDPDDPALPGTLRGRLSDLDAALSPLHVRLEQFDDALTIYDVEVGRAARALHQSLPEPELAEHGLDDDCSIEDALRHAKSLGDRVYSSTVERDALLAGGAIDPGDARRAVAEVIADAGQRARREADAVALIARMDEATDDEAVAVDTPDPTDTLSATAVEPVTEDGEATDDARTRDEEMATELRDGLAALEAAAAERAGEATPGAGFDAVAATGSSLRRIEIAGDDVVAVDAGGARTPWAELPASDRSAAAHALAVGARQSAGAPSGAQPTFVVLDAAPADLDDAALLRAVAAGSAAVRQVVIPGPEDSHGTKPVDDAAPVRRRERRRRA